jgi:zona occludens toxin
MITLVTGGPGTGKTAWLIHQLLELKKAQPYRELFIHGVRKLTAFPHQTIFCRSPLCDLCTASVVPDESLFVEDWPQWYKSHYLIVVDEVQRIWSQSNGNNRTDAISRLQTHRHYGLDFWLISQSPKLIHVDVKAMVGRHVHLVAKWSGRKEFEWPEIQENTQLRSGAVERPYKLPKHVFSLYSSAEVHTKQEKRKPLSFYAAVGALFFALCAVATVVYRMKSRINPVVESSVSSDGGGGALAPLLPSDEKGFNSSTFDKVPMSTPEQIQIAMTPVVVGLPWSAPIYKDLVKPVSMPVVVGCIKSMKKDDFRCSCYTQQATIVEMPPDVCSLYVQHQAFNHFKPDLNKVLPVVNDSVNVVSMK